MNVEEKLLEILKDIDEDIDASKITMDSGLTTDLDLSSVSLIYMAVAIEQEFGVDLANENLQGVSTVGDVVNIIKNRG